MVKEYYYAYTINKKVLDFFGIEPFNKNIDNDIFAWYANIEIVDRKKLLILMYQISRFYVLIF
jgi:hypothetical protein